MCRATLIRMALAEKMGMAPAEETGMAPAEKHVRRVEPAHDPYPNFLRGVPTAAYRRLRSRGGGEDVSLSRTPIG